MEQQNISDYNLFMMCRAPRKEAFAPLPAGFHFDLCRREELETYRRQSEFFAKHHEKPDGMAYRLGEIQAKAAYTAYFGGRAVRSLKRRLTGQQK